MYNNESQFVKNYKKNCFCMINNDTCLSLPNITISSENDIINRIFNNDSFDKILFNNDISSVKFRFSKQFILEI